MQGATVLVRFFRTHPIRAILLAARSEQRAAPEALVSARSLDSGSAPRGVSLSEVSSARTGLWWFHRVTGSPPAGPGARGLCHSPSQSLQAMPESSPGAPEKAVSGGLGLSLAVRTFLKAQDLAFRLSHARNDLFCFPEFV